jgi:hypothetical protein
MAITLDTNRQEVIAARVQVTYATLGNDVGTSEGIIQVPEGAKVVGGYINISEVFDSTTSDTIDIGDGVDPDEYTATIIDAQVAACTALTITGYTYTAQDNIDIQWTAGTTSTATQGIAEIVVLYIVEGRGAFNQG